MGGTAGTLFGRRRELEAALRLLDDTGIRAIELVGEAGIGKTAVLDEVTDVARGRGWRVLSAAPSASEVQLTFAGLGDLIGSLDEPILADLAPPQRRALEVALLRADGPAVDARAVGLAVQATIRRLADAQPLLIAIDDLGSLDAPSAHALEFALRRVDPAPVAVVATWRDEDHETRTLDLERAFGPTRVTRLHVGPLTLAAIHELLLSRLGAEVPRPALVALAEAAGGNPFLTVELARELERRGIAPAPGTPLPIPARVKNVVSARLERVPREVRDLLLAAAELTRPSTELLGRIRPDAESLLHHAADAGIVELRADGAVRFAHPLLARVPYEGLEPSERRELHARLAGVVDDAEERVRHRALAASEQSATVASELEDAAASAGARGAAESAAELCRLAARLTPPAQRDERCARLLAAAEWHHRGADVERAAAVAETLVSSTGTGAVVRARALSLLAAVRADTEGVGAAIELYGQARREPDAPAAVRAEIHRRCAWLNLGAGDARAADRHGRAALRLAAGQDPACEAGATAVDVLTEVVRGRRLRRELLARACALEAAASEVGPGVWPETAPSVVEGVALLWAGELEQARAPLERVRGVATERDEPWLEMHSLAYLSALATGIGELRLGFELAARYLELADGTDQPPQRAGALWPLAVAAAWLGDEPGARDAATEGRALAQASGHTLYEIGCLGALGLIELAAGRPDEASIALERAGELTRTSGIVALGRVPLLPDLIEALTALGELDRAGSLAAELERRAIALEAPWALALAQRCHGLVAEARGEREGAIDAFERALAYHARQPRPPEQARTELALGSALRRDGRKRAARETLERSVCGFETIGARVWAERARRELARIGGRPVPAGGGLSATETSITELVRVGRTNREIAAELHLSPKTVEWNLSKIYRKLGVRSRTELAATLARAGA
ncbi:MAG: helix-turn-helix transcriptional regulator [Solirubrobacteraceae bacterium]